MIAPARSGSQKQFAERPVEDETNCISQTMEWTRRNLGREDLTVNHMAAVANLTRRSFDRNFRQVTGTSPNQWLIAERVRWAAELLETNSLSIERIATKTGFGSDAAFRLHFTRTIGVPPREYRNSKTTPQAENRNFL